MEKKWLKLPPFQLTQETLALATKTSIIVFATIAVFFQDLAIIFSDALQNETTSYVLAVPFMLVYLIYRKRKMIKVATSFEPSKGFKIATSELIGVLLLFGSFLLYWYGSYTFSPLEYHVVALPIFTSACILILFDIQTLKQLVFPIAFLLLLVPPPAESLYYVGAILSAISSNLAYAVVKFLGFPVGLSTEHGTPIILVTQQDGTLLSFAVDVACSGIYSLIGFFVFTLFLAYLVRDKTWKKPFLFLVGFPLIYLLNVTRIFSIVIIGYYYGIDLALTVFHLFGGWILIFFGTFLLLLISEKLLKLQIFANQTKKCTECNLVLEIERNFCYACGRIHKTHFPQIKKKDISKIVGLITCTILILSIQAPVFALTEGPAEILLQNPQGQPLTTEIFPQAPGYTLQFMYRDVEFEQIAKQDASLMYAYLPSDSTKSIIWAAIEIAPTFSVLHRWETCLITWPTTHGYQPKVNQLKLEDLELLQNPPIIGRYFVFQWRDSNLTEAVLYWYETSIFNLNTTSQQKNVKISLITYPPETETVEQTENNLLTLGKAITRYWQPIKTWSPTTLFISQKGSYLLIILAATITVVGFLQIFNQTKSKQTNLKAYQKLSKENKATIESVYLTKTMATPSNIATTYENRYKKAVAINVLVDELQKAKAAGFIHQQLINFHDEPLIGWKVQFSPSLL